MGECVGEDGAGAYVGLGEGGEEGNVVLETECGCGGTANIKCVCACTGLHAYMQFYPQPPNA